MSTRDELGITGTTELHYGPSIGKCTSAAQGESKIVVSVLVTFRSLLKHVCQVSWCLIVHTLEHLNSVS